MATYYLDKDGLTYLWSKIKAKFVEQEVGKGLSTNDYTTAEKEKLAGVAIGAEVNAINTIKVNGTAQTITNKAVDIAVPTALSDLNNDGNFVTDANYVHTDNNYTSAEKTKLAGIAEGAEVNVQADWSQTTTTADDFIKNKPTIGTGTLTIQKNGTTVQTFSANNVSNVTADITVPTKTSDLTNDGDGTAGSTFPTAAEVDSAIATAVGQITSFEYEVVSSLPASGETGVIYLILDSSASAPNTYNEYIWIGDKYETLGTTAMDLSNYVQFSDIATAAKTGVVKSSTTGDGSVAINSSTGVMTVNGYSTLAGKVTTLETAVGDLTAITNAEIDQITA